ncbi:sialyltransferase [Bathycoccus prasinos]|uniref:Sialyltransferase n=1 Tax=Bathycoccus prasinos TaxID=41875 RepID=K8F7H6_9CHLO|nr:sialyltransferase [Bathycoccus prasinos]CCO20785.1 sialyltransferase [Bathycoccus prasinos]|eukprot:XP_007508066.1 sialyltransferase [Bathycoccus prasinos]
MREIYCFTSIVISLIFLTLVSCERRGVKLAPLRPTELRRLLKNSESTGTFFTQENIKINSWHVTARWWRTQFLDKLSINFNQTDIDYLCSIKSSSCTFFDRTEWEQLPSVKPSSWKSCAVVGYGSNLLDIPRGTQIDSYDTVFRLGMVPLSKFRIEAGLKNNFVYIRDRKLRRSKGNFVDEDKNGFRASQLHNSYRPKAIVYSSYRKNPTANWATITFGGDLTLRLERTLKLILRRMNRSGLPPDPSSGLVLPAVLLFSGHCTKIGIFGISTTMGSRYWEVKPRDDLKGKTTRYKSKPRNLASNHNTKLEALIWKTIGMMEPITKEIKVEFYD